MSERSRRRLAIALGWGFFAFGLYLVTQYPRLPLVWLPIIAGGLAVVWTNRNAQYRR